MQDARPLLFLGVTFLCFSAVNFSIGLSLLGEKGEQNRQKILDAFRAVRKLNDEQIAAAQQREANAAQSPKAAQ